MYQFAAVVAAMGVLITAYLWARARMSAASVVIGAFVLLALVALIGLPFAGAASTLVLPALPVLVSLHVARFFTTRPPLPLVAVTIGAVPARCS